MNIFIGKRITKTYLEEAAKETDAKPVFSERCCYVVAETIGCHHQVSEESALVISTDRISVANPA